MARFKTFPVFYSLITALGLAAVGASWCIYERSQTAQRSANALNKKHSELNQLQSVVPTPSEQNKALIKADLVRSEDALTLMRAELKGQGQAADALQKARAAYVQAAALKPSERAAMLREAKVPYEPTDLFFNIATFVEKMRESTHTANIKTKADERFGFATYANAGPERDLIPSVFRQRQVAEYLMGAMIEAKPNELVAFQRELPAASSSPVAAKTSAALSRGSATNTNPDLFEIDPRITARVPGFVDASAFRLTFIGETACLRSLLNKLATFELPLVVRGVEVDPLSNKSDQAPEKAAPANTLSSIFGITPSEAPEIVNPKPLVEKVLSKFTVTVELIDLVALSPSEATPTL
jgi:hypothetical protein